MLYANENAYDDLILPLATANNVPVALIKAIIGVESNFIPTAENLSGRDGARGGSYGLMQLSYLTAQGMGYSGDPSGLLDPETNLTLAIGFLGTQMDRAAGDPATTAAFYNGGHATGGGNFSDQAYVSAVMTNYAYYSGQPGSTPGGTAGGLEALGASVLIALFGWLIVK